MALTVGVDTYITIQEMNDYVSKYYPSSDPLRVQWESMDEADQEVYLRKSFVQINSLPYTGKPKTSKQTLPFPRYHGFTESDLLNVKYAQAEQGIALTDTVALDEVSQRVNLRRAGVVRYRIGDLQEQFQSGLPVDSNANFFGLSERAYQYLSKWLRGGYRVCTSIKRHYGIWWWYPLS